MIVRQREHELMDDPLLDRHEHMAALDALAKLNSVSGAARLLWTPIRRLYQDLFSLECKDVLPAAQVKRLKPLRILDIGCGGGDVIIQLCRIANESGIQVEIDGCDISPVAIIAAKERAKRARQKARFFVMNALTDEIPLGYDVIISSLFTHHLSEQEVQLLLRKMAKSTNHLIVISDLVRSRLCIVLVKLACETLTRSRVAKFDGPASVRSAFTAAEFSSLAKHAGLTGTQVIEKFPCRWLLSWRKPDVA